LLPFDINTRDKRADNDANRTKYEASAGHVPDNKPGQDTYDDDDCQIFAGF
jgi:hypothetical protein